MHWYEMPVRFRGELYILPMCRPVKEDFASMFPYMTAVMAMSLASAKLYKPVSIGTWARMCVFYVFTATQWYSESSSFALHLPITGPVVLILLCATVGIGRDDAFYSRLPLPWTKSDSESAGDSSQQRPGQSSLRAIKSALRRALEFARSESVEQAATMASYLTFFVELSLFRQYDRYPIMPFKPWIYSFIWHQLVLLPSYLLHAETLSEVLQSLATHLLHSLPLLSFRCVVTTWHTADTGETSFTLSRLFTTDDTDPTLYY